LLSGEGIGYERAVRRGLRLTAGAPRAAPAIDLAARPPAKAFAAARNYVFEAPPSEAEWQSQLAGQTRLNVDAADALMVVREAWARVIAAEHGN